MSARKKKKTRDTPLVLCYAEEGEAWFTTQDLRNQWGDYWGEKSYKRVSGHPHAYTKYDREEGLEIWDIVRVSFSGPFSLPHPSMSVEEINAKKAPWLSASSSQTSPIEIFAGTTLDEFVDMVTAAGGVASSPKRMESSIV